MLEFLKTPFLDGPSIKPHLVLIRLVMALVFGLSVAWIYRHTRKTSQLSSSLPGTLVLLAVLIAMVTQVIGDNVARAFSLVGALSIVRFRTVVRDTQDTAYVIFAVVVGMAVGAKDLWVAVIGIPVIGVAAWLMMGRFGPLSSPHPPLLVNVRVGLGNDPTLLLRPVFEKFLIHPELMRVTTAGKGAALEVTYHARLMTDRTAEDLVNALNQIEGVQRVEVQRAGFDQD